MNPIVCFIYDTIMRLKTESPAYFKKLQLIAVVLLIIVICLKYSISTGLWLPPKHDAVNQLINVFLGFVTGLLSASGLAKKDPPKE